MPDVGSVIDYSGYVMGRFETPLNLKKWTKIKLKGIKLNYTERNDSFTVGFSKEINLNSINNCVVKSTKSFAQSTQNVQIDMDINLQSINDDDDYYLYFYFGGTFATLKGYTGIEYVNISEIWFS